VLSMNDIWCIASRSYLMCVVRRLLLLALLIASSMLYAQAAPSVADHANTASISGRVYDEAHEAAAGALVKLVSVDGSVHRETPSDENGEFRFSDLATQLRYVVTVSAPGFITWNSTELQLSPGEQRDLSECPLRVQKVETVINVTPETAAALQVEEEVHQRVLGVIPNFYTVYDHQQTPLTAKMKFRLAYKVSTDPITGVGVAFLAGVEQGARMPDYQLGARGYGQRFGAIAADGVTDIFIGGALLPSLLHQDPRYYYQGTGSKSSRFRHAVINPFVCYGDNGKRQVNYSSMGGDLASSAISNLYYPSSNRGASLIFTNFAISTAERVASSLLQEFVISKFMKHKK